MSQTGQTDLSASPESFYLFRWVVFRATGLGDLESAG